MITLRFHRASYVLLSVLLTVAFVSPAFADPISAKRAQAARVESQIDALGTKAEIAAERYNGARYRHEQLVREVRTTEQRIAKLERRTTNLQKRLNRSANEMYRQGPLGFLGVLLGSTSFEHFATTWDVLSDMNERRGETVAELRATKAAADKAHAKLVIAEKAAAKQQKAMAANKRAVEQQLAARQRVLNGLNVDIASLIRQKQVAEARAARARQLALERRQRAAAAAARAASARVAPASRGSALERLRGAATLAWRRRLDLEGCRCRRLRAEQARPSVCLGCRRTELLRL